MDKALDRQEGGGHYKSLTIQPVEYIQKNNIPYLEGNVIKYITRHKSKNGLEDLKKAKHYIDLIIELEYPKVQDNAQLTIFGHRVDPDNAD